MSNSEETVAKSFLHIKQIMDELREQCPWDRKQTIHSLQQLTIEETYELADAITKTDWPNIKEELGDILLHILFYAKIADEQQQFTLTEVMDGLADKLIRRHPHIYDKEAQQSLELKTDEDVKRNWEKIKLAEGKKSVLSGVPKSLPAVVKAMRLQEKARQVGFEWDHINDVWDKVEEELGEMKAAIAANNQQHIEEEFGDVLFSMINYARFLNIDAEAALAKTNNKFIDRFEAMEALAAQKNLDFAALSLQEKDALWTAIKHQ